MAGTGFGGAIAPTPLVRSWRTAFLTLRDETLTNPHRNSTAQLLHNLIFSHSHTLLSAAPELSSHEVLSDIAFLMELVAATSSDEEDCVRIYTQTSRLVHDICRHVKFDLNSSSFGSVLGSFRKMLDRFLGIDATGDKLTGVCRAAAIVPAVECLHAIRCIITLPHRRRLQSEDTILVKFLLHVIVSSQESSSSELQAVCFEMLGEAISRAGSSFPVDIWRSMFEVVRKTMDVMVLKTPVVEDNAMSRFYESFLSCLHLILTDAKCSVSEHVSVFVAVLRMFLNYGLSGRIPSTLLVGHTKKNLNYVSPKVHRDQLNKSDHSVYRPPHLRKKDCSNVKPNRATYSQYISDSESSAINVTSSDSDFSDGDGSAKESARGQYSRVRVATIICMQDLCQADSKSFSMQWSLLLPTSDVLQPRMRDATLMTCLLFDPCLKSSNMVSRVWSEPSTGSENFGSLLPPLQNPIILTLMIHVTPLQLQQYSLARMASASTLAAMLDGPSSIFLQAAEYKESSKVGSFTALSSSLGQILLEIHKGILYLIQNEAHGKLLALLFKIIRLLILHTPYSRMPPNLLPTVITSLRIRVEEGFHFKSDRNNLLDAAVSCLTLALSTSPSSAQVKKLLFDEVSSGYLENEKKSGVLALLFEYSSQGSCPSICLEALQALKAVSHNYPSIVTTCWGQVFSIVYGFLSIVCPEVPSKQSNEHVGSTTASINEKILIAAIKVLDECLRAVSGFQGTEDLSDDKVTDVPFTSDCIRMKKVSSAPSYELECKEDDVVSSEECESGIKQWCEAMEKHMPLILCHSSAMARAASVTCFAGMTSSVFISFTKEKQNFILSSLVHTAVHDNASSVRSAACRAIGVISCFPQVCQSAEVLDKFIHAIEKNTRDSLISVRITASWALANICDAIRHCVKILHFGQMGEDSNSNPQFIVSLSECALRLTEDGDKVKSNAVRALGYISQIFNCSTLRPQDTFEHNLDQWSEAPLTSENPIMCKRRCLLESLEDFHRLEKIVQAFVSCITTGNVKVQWNACHALGNLFLNETLRLQDMSWASVVFGILLQLLHNSSNYKIRIQAAAALAVPLSAQDYGRSFSDIVRSIEHIMENIDQDSISGPSNFKYKVSLQKQLTLTMLHVLRFTSSTNDQLLKDFLVKKASIFEVWFKELCSSVGDTVDVHDKSIADRKKVMISSAIHSLIEVYKEKQQYVIAQKFVELNNNI